MNVPAYVDIEYKIKKHRAFWDMEEVDVPVIGLFVGGWTFFKDNRGADNIWSLDRILPEHLEPERFIEDYERLFGTENELGDDLIRAAQPFSSIPWMEAIVGCPVRCSRPNVWSEPIAANVTQLSDISFDAGNLWVCKYIEFLEVFEGHFKNQHPVNASILRGPLDILSAMIGDQAAIYAFLDYPEQTEEVLRKVTESLCNFIEYQWQHISKFVGGYTIPQNEIWVPNAPLRMQEDASALISPAIYENFVFAFDKKIASLTEYSTMHLHTTSLFLMDYFIGNKSLGIIQISRDDGYENFEDLIAYLNKIQAGGKRLILRGVFTLDELELIREEVSPVGFCVHCVVENKQQGLDCMEILRKPWLVR